MCIYSYYSKTWISNSDKIHGIQVTILSTSIRSAFIQTHTTWYKMGLEESSSDISANLYNTFNQDDRSGGNI